MSGRIHQSLAVRVQPVVTLVQAGVHLGPVEILRHVGGARYDGRTFVGSVGVLLHVLSKVRFLEVLEIGKKSLENKLKV